MFILDDERSIPIFLGGTGDCSHQGNATFTMYVGATQCDSLYNFYWPCLVPNKLAALFVSSYFNFIWYFKRNFHNSYFSISMSLLSPQNLGI